jgi:AcrR family transcriptional regulator
MARHVDDNARRSDIARAVIRIVAAQGLDSVTFRSVAAELGASTAVITHYVPDRGALLDLAFGALRREVGVRLAAAGSRSTPRERLLGLIVSGLALDGDTASWLAYGRFLAHPGRTDWEAALREDNAAYLTALREALAAVSPRVPVDVAVDLCVALADGLTVNVLVDRSAWPAARQMAAVHGLLDALGVPPDPPSPAGAAL